MSDERRIAERVTPQPGHMHVYDRFAGTELGTIANISETGFMLVTRQFIETDSVFQLELSFSQEDKNEKIQLGAVCLWCADTSTENSFWAGFHIIDISPQKEELLKKIISEGST